MSAERYAAGGQEPRLRNELSGKVDGPVVQAGEVHGDVHIHVQSPSGPELMPGPERAPDQVPPLTVRFINRDPERRRLDFWFGAGAEAFPEVRLGALSGLPGVGKTATVCRWAQDSRDLFPDGMLYVDFALLRDVAGVGGDVSEALAVCLRGLGVAERYLPALLEGRQDLFREWSAKRRLLVVLDGVSQATQVRPLVPKGPGSVLLVISHGQLSELAVNGARMVPLEPLDPDSGVRILADRCEQAAVDAEPVAARRLVELCGGLPVALHVVAARLLTNRRLTMARLVDELTDESHRLVGMSLRGEHSVSAVLTLAYAELPQDAARLYRLLGWLPARTFDTATAAVVGDGDIATADRLVGVLMDASLLEGLPGDRFRLHDLVRLHARERAAAEEPAAAQGALVERVIAHYLVLAALADRALRADRLRIADLSELLEGVPDPFCDPDGLRPLDWFEAERPNIVSVLRAAARGGLHRPVWQLAEAFTSLFLHRRYLADWQESLELGAQAATQAVEPAAEARLRSLLSRPLMDLEDYDRAHEELDKAVACADVAGDAAVSASVHEFYGRYWDRFDPARATEAYRRSIELNLEAGELRGVAIATLFLGRAQDAGGDHATALRTLRRAHADLLALGDGDERMAARALAAIGTVLDHLGDTEAALRILGEAAGKLHELGAGHYEAETRVALADLLERTGGSPDAVRDHLVRAHAVYAKGGSPQAEVLRVRLAGLEQRDEGRPAPPGVADEAD